MKEIFYYLLFKKMLNGRVKKSRPFQVGGIESARFGLFQTKLKATRNIYMKYCREFSEKSVFYRDFLLFLENKGNDRIKK